MPPRKYKGSGVARAAGAVVDSYFFEDTFTDGDGDLADHAPEVGSEGQWFASGHASPPTANISANRARLQDIGDGAGRYWEIDSGESDLYTLRVSCFLNSINPGWLGLTFRSDGSVRADTLNRWVTYVDAIANLLYLNNPTAGSQNTALVTGVSDELLFEVSVDGTLVTVVATNISTGATATLTSTSTLNLYDTYIGLFQRTVFGGGSQDFYDHLRMSALGK